MGVGEMRLGALSLRKQRQNDVTAKEMFSSNARVKQKLKMEGTLEVT